MAAGGGVATLGNHNRVRRVVEGPPETGLQRVGLHRTRHLGVLLPPHGVGGDLAGGAHRGVCRREKMGRGREKLREYKYCWFRSYIGITVAPLSSLPFLSSILRLSRVKKG